MTSIELKCSCGQSSYATTAQHGKTLQCPRCKTLLPVPDGVALLSPENPKTQRKQAEPGNPYFATAAVLAVGGVLVWLFGQRSHWYIQLLIFGGAMQIIRKIWQRPAEDPPVIVAGNGEVSGTCPYCKATSYLTLGPEGEVNCTLCGRSITSAHTD